MGLAVEEPQPERPLITMLKKQGRRVIENTDDIMLSLDGTFPLADFAVIEGGQLATMSIKAQVSINRDDVCF